MCHYNLNTIVSYRLAILQVASYMYHGAIIGSYNLAFLNQARAWFLRIALSVNVGMCVYVSLA